MDKKIEEIIQSLEAQFTGDSHHDVDVLRQYCRSLPRNEENLAVVTAVGRYAAEHFPDEEVVKDAKRFEEAYTRFTDMIEKAQGCLKAGKFEEGIALFEELVGEVKPPVEENKKYCSFVHPFEEMLFRSGYGREKEVERISTLPQFIYMQMGGAYFEMKRYEDAKKYYGMALELCPVSFPIYMELLQIAKVEKDMDECRRLLDVVYPYLFTRGHLARFYREYAGLAMIEEQFELALSLIYLSLDYEDSGQARAQLNSIAKHREVDLSKPKIDTVKQRLADAKIPLGPSPSVYELAMYIGKQMKGVYPDAARMAFSIAYDITHYEPLLREIESC